MRAQSTADTLAESPPEEDAIADLLGRMTLEEKVGQLVQVNYDGPSALPELIERVRHGAVGSIINLVDVETVDELQRVALEESRSGIPLLIGRDVIHGFRTVFPIPLGQAASWDPDAVRAAARIAAIEAATCGVNWTFAPMIDVSRDPRWGRVAESFGEDPFLASRLGAAMVEGLQGDDQTAIDALAACAKHFAGYGASEAGRDYNTVDLSERELREVHLPPFRAVANAGVASFMTSFSDLNGVPATANEFLLRTVLREEWGYDGVVVSDWRAIAELIEHGVAADEVDAARQAALAGVDVDMVSECFAQHLGRLVEQGAVPVARLDEMVANVVRMKLRFGLAARAPALRAALPAPGGHAHLEAAHRAAVGSLVLLKNEGVLPLDAGALARLAVIGPLADDGYEQLGTWIFDGDPAVSRTPLGALRDRLGDAVAVEHVRALPHTRSRDESGFPAAVEAAARADVALVFVGEESILSGEAHSRADIRLPGAQEALIRAVSATGTPVVVVLMAGRPLALGDVIDAAEAWLCAWHPGTMAGPAVADVLLGIESPAGKLPMTFPRMSGQVPIYYAHRNTGRPARDVALMDELPVRAPQHSAGNVSFHMDAGSTPLFPFGHGLSYTRFEYDEIEVTPGRVEPDGAFEVSVRVSNRGARAGIEVVQLYVGDEVASVTRPVRELKGFERVRLEPGESRLVRFHLRTDDLAFHDRSMRRVTEPGSFRVAVGGSSAATLEARFVVGTGNRRAPA